LKLKIKTLQNAPRDPDELKRLLIEKEKESERARHVQDIERLVTEIGTLKVIWYFWCVKIEEKKKKLVRKEYIRQEERKK
jgi:hypothetical protein